MKVFERPFVPGSSPIRILPLGRFIPPVPGGMAAAWLREQAAPGEWVLDPFGSSPAAPIELARAGYRVLVSSNNPILTFMLEMLASAPRPEDFQAALAELGSLRRGSERLEIHLQNLYATECPGCGTTVQAQGFLWKKDEGQPFARMVDCPHCKTSGEFPLQLADQERLKLIGIDSLHRARALERVVSAGDEDRPVVEEAARSYLPRPLYVLSTIINRVEGLPDSEARRKQHLYALLLSLLDEGSSLWPHPSARTRPRQLTIPPQFKENNLWLALDAAISAWCDGGPAVPLTHWPELPPPGGGICVYPGRLRALLPLPETLRPRAVLTVLPRPNQAFWTLSAVWAGWLWGRESVQALKIAFDRRRYDWHWHTSALYSVFSALNAHLPGGFPILALLPELAPGFLVAALAASQSAGLGLEGLALRGEPALAQAAWKTRQARTVKLAKPPEIVIREGISEHLCQNGQPDGYLALFTAGLTAFALQGGFSANQPQLPDQAIDSIQPIMTKIFGNRDFVVRCDSAGGGMDNGQYWLADDQNADVPLAERVEDALTRYLDSSGPSTLPAIEKHLCAMFPGLRTPSADLLRALLESYAEPAPGQPDAWRMRTDQAAPVLTTIRGSALDLLAQLASRFHFDAVGSQPLLWRTASGRDLYALYVISRAKISSLLLGPNPLPPSQCVLIYPAVRASLLYQRLQSNPRLTQAILAGWRLLQIERLTEFAASPAPTLQDWEELLNTEPPHWREATQMQMF